MRRQHIEHHYGSRIGWLRAAVLGANDGIVSTASLVIGVTAANVGQAELLIAAIAGLVSGAMSMAAGEYVSVCSQADAQKADIEREQLELATNVNGEREELANIYVGRGLDSQLAAQVAAQLMAHNALGAHLRDELGLTDIRMARPLQAALASAAAFSVGATLPVILVTATPMGSMIMVISLSSLASLAVLGTIAAKVGGAGMLKGAARVTFWGALAMLATAAIGHIFGTLI